MLFDRGHVEPGKLANFERVTGIKKTRRWPTSTEGLAKAAIDEYLAGGFSIEDVGCLIAVTQSPDRLSPCLAVELHRHLYLPTTIPVFDVNQSCDGFIYGLWLAARMPAPTLVVCVDKLRAKPGEIDNLIFSDAACAMVVENGIERSHVEFLTDGNGSQYLRADDNGLLEMDGGAVYDFVTKRVPRLINQFNAEVGPHDVLVQHQANLSMMRIVERRTVFTGRSIHSIEEYGNMSMVSLPAALAYGEKELLGKKVLLCGYGAGWCAAVASIDWPETPITQLSTIDFGGELP